MYIAFQLNTIRPGRHETDCVQCCLTTHLAFLSSSSETSERENLIIARNRPPKPRLTSHAITHPLPRHSQRSPLSDHSQLVYIHLHITFAYPSSNNIIQQEDHFEIQREDITPNKMAPPQSGKSFRSLLGMEDSKPTPQGEDALSFLTRSLLLSVFSLDDLNQSVLGISSSIMTHALSWSSIAYGLNAKKSKASLQFSLKKEPSNTIRHLHFLS